MWHETFLVVGAPRIASGPGRAEGSPVGKVAVFEGRPVGKEEWPGGRALGAALWRALVPARVPRLLLVILGLAILVQARGILELVLEGVLLRMVAEASVEFAALSYLVLPFLWLAQLLLGGAPEVALAPVVVGGKEKLAPGDQASLEEAAAPVEQVAMALSLPEDVAWWKLSFLCLAVTLAIWRFFLGATLPPRPEEVLMGQVAGFFFLATPVLAVAGLLGLPGIPLAPPAGVLPSEK